MIAFLKKLFKGEEKEIHKSPATEDQFDSLVGEPVISFVKCLKQDPKRFKLKIHKKVEAISSGNWGEIYDWMDNGKVTGYYSLSDRKTGDKYYAIYHQQKIYTVHGFDFNLNWWELVALSKEFQEFRSAARDRKRAINIRARNRILKERELEEQQARLKLADKFK